MPTLFAAIDARKFLPGAFAIEKSLRKVAGGAKLGRDQLGRFQKKVTTVGQVAKGASFGLGSFATAFLGIAGARKAIDTISSFEETLATVRGVTGATELEFQKLTKSARDLGATTRFSATEAGEGLLFLARAGFTTSEALQALPDTLNLAQAGGLELGEAADFASNILAQFNLTADETVRVVDTLIATSNRANTDVRQLAQALKFVGPVAGALGQSVEETSSALGVLGNSGIQASLAGTNLRGILSALLDPTRKGTIALEKMGIAAGDVSPATNSLTEIMQQFKDANLSASDAVGLFGRRNAGAALILSGNVGVLSDLTEATKDANGEAAKMARLMDDTLSGALKNLKSSIEEAILQFGDNGFGGTMRVLVDTLTSAIRIALGLQVAFERQTPAAKTLATVLKVVVGIFGAWIAMKPVTFIFALSKAFITNLIPAIVKTQAVLTPLLALLGVLAAFRFGKFLFEEFKMVQNAANDVISAWDKMTAFMGFAWDLVVEGFSFTFDIFVSAIKKSIAFIVDELAALIDAAEILGAALGDGVGDALRTSSSDLKRFSRTLRVGAKDFSDIVDGSGKNQQKLTDQFNADLARIDKTRVTIRKQIEADFAGKERKGNTFVDTIAEDLTKLERAIKDKVGQFFGLEPAIVQTRKELEALVEAGEITIKVDAPDLTGLEKDMKRINKEIEGVTEESKDAAKAMDKLNDSVADGLADVAFEAENASDVFRKLASEILKSIVQAEALKPLTKQATDFTGVLVSAFVGAVTPTTTTGGTTPQAANGAMFNGGNATFFASGGIVNGATAFPMSGGGTGVAGEAGPEAILPLENRGGKLGVKGGGGTVVNVTMNINTPDADSFKKSQGQIVSGLGSSIRQSTRGNR